MPGPARTLAVVGVGLQFGTHVTLAAKGWIEKADKVWHVVADPATIAWIHNLNPSAEALSPPSEPGRVRNEVFNAMADRVVASLEHHRVVSAVFYGHPGILVSPARAAIALATAGGHRTVMVPGISAADCLFSDLKFDPGETGWHSYDATDFLIHGRTPDPTCALLLYQVGLIGDPYYASYSAEGMRLLVSALAEVYGADHAAILYEASVYPICEPRIEETPISRLPDSRIGPSSLLYVPPAHKPKLKMEVLARLAKARAQT
jgi:uncharacterized protein YabN with tetrapyrrole methylase and pyrophosphatase domain